MLGAETKVAWQTQGKALVGEASVSDTELGQPPTCPDALILRAAIKHGVGGGIEHWGPSPQGLPRVMCHSSITTLE